MIPFKELRPVVVSGQVESYNPKNATTVKLLQGGVVKYEVTIPAADTGSGKATQEFNFDAVAVGVYDLVVEKACHLTYTIEGIEVGEDGLDLREHTNAKISTIKLLCGDLNGNGHIDFGDYEILLSGLHYGKSNSDCVVNFN